MIKIKVDGSVVSVQETVALYCGSQDVYTCSFTFDTGWERFSKSAVFRVNGETITRLLDENGECVLPWELLVRSNIGQDIEVGMYGVSADAEILTSVWDSIGLVREGSELGNDAREPSAGVYEQVMANVQRVDEKVDNYNTEVQTQVQRAESAAAVALGSAESATESAVTAERSAATADSAKEAVLNAIDNLPVGSTLVINDLTTGGTAAALSAEMGRKLNADKLSNSNDTMTGSLARTRTISNLEYKSVDQIADVSSVPSACLDFYEGGTWYSRLGLSKTGLKVKLNGGSYYDILHTGNKPTGTYVGTGDATTQIIDTKGIGKGVLIYGGSMCAIVAPNGCIGWYTANNGAVATVPNTEVSYANGKLTISTTSNLVNYSGLTYAYQVF